MNKTIFTLLCVVVLATASAGTGWSLELSPLGTYKTGIFDGSAAEIIAYDPEGKQLFVTNDKDNAVDVLDVSTPAKPTKVMSIDMSPYGAGVNSVAVKNGLVAAAVEADPKQDPGVVAFFRTDGTPLFSVPVGALPDMVTFTPDGWTVLAACEGEPSGDYQNDPEGSVAVIKLMGTTGARVRLANFRAFNHNVTGLQRSGVRVFGPGATPAQDFEPEYIAVSTDSKWAWISLQENNAIAQLDIENAAIVNVFGLPLKDFSRHGLDASNKDGFINITTYDNIWGMYMPDSIAAYTTGGKTYLVTANEGDSRDYEWYSEEARIKDVDLDPLAYPNAEEIQDEAVLGLLKMTTAEGDFDMDGDYDMVHAYGGRSFSIWETGADSLKLVYDSGSEFEFLTAMELPGNFNSTNDKNNSFDSRSDDKGPEPEALTLGKVDGRVYAFIGLERLGGVIVYDVTDPAAASFETYVTTRDFTGDPKKGTAGDLAPEGMVFIPADQSPSGQNLLAVANEVSGTTTVFAVE